MLEFSHLQSHRIGVNVSILLLLVQARAAGASVPSVAVPNGPGLGVTYDWDFIDRNRGALHVIE